MSFSLAVDILQLALPTAGYFIALFTTFFTKKVDIGHQNKVPGTLFSMMNLEKVNVMAADGSKAIAMFKLPEDAYNIVF